MLKKCNLGTRMLVSISTIVIIAFALTITIVAYKASNMAKRFAFNETREMTAKYGELLKVNIEESLGAARTLASVFEGVKADGTMVSREQMDAVMTETLKSNSAFLTVWSAWEPDAFDGQDDKYKNTPGTDSTGRYITCLSRNGSQIIKEALTDIDTSDYYLIPKKSGEESMIEPYKYVINGKEILMTSACVPIRHKGAIVGVVGVDLDLATIDKQVKQIKPFETGYAYLMSHEGVLVGHPNSDFLGKVAGTLNKTCIDAIAALKNNSSHEAQTIAALDKSKSFAFFCPVKIGRTKTPWMMGVSVPLNKILADAKAMTKISITIGLFSVAGLMVVVFMIARAISNPLNRISSMMSEGADQVASASGQVSAASQSLAEGATEQAASLEETSSSLEEMASMTKQNADNAQQANALAVQAKKAADEGSEAMERMNHAINDIQKSSDQTAKIIKVIDEIAFQTNLLALNAAVEAARAGEAGKGFAVVAEEVRNLAMRSAEAAKNTSSLIEESVKNSNNGVEMVDEVAKKLTEITSTIAKVNDLVSEISAASNEQAQGIDQINQAVSQMDKVTQGNAANAEESASASEEMSAQASQMKDMVGELVAVIRGANDNITQPVRKVASHQLGHSDHVFHHIASGKPAAKPQKVSRPSAKAVSQAEKEIPFDDKDGFDTFNK